MRETKDGGPAFPRSNRDVGGYPGMSLRDYFAGQALAGLPMRAWADEDGKMPDDIFEKWAFAAYATADAMIAARGGQQ